MKSALLSKIAMCVCPPAIVATSAVTVPPVKRAVHRLTAPVAAPARPKPRRVFSAAYDCTPTAVPLSNAAPMGMAVVAPTDATGTTPAPAGVPTAAPTALSVRSPAEAFTPVSYSPPPYVGPLVFAPSPTPTTPSEVTPTVPAALPEMSTWAMTITGFGAIGWSLRRKARPAEAPVEIA